MSNSKKLQDSEATINELKALVQRFVKERKWSKHHKAKNLSMSIAIEAAELMEHFQWTPIQEAQRSSKDRLRIEEEVADVAAYLLALCHVLNIDLSSAMQKKMIKNAKKYPISNSTLPRYK
ncbi:MAG: NTP pyrophosphatase (non-canonical NTP hydrolase) [Candidatus Omnitrophota bacterium]|jgi:NTP pyrophosphatase (non-canonical NTP hydrolase)